MALAPPAAHASPCRASRPTISGTGLVDAPCAEGRPITLAASATRAVCAPKRRRMALRRAPNAVCGSRTSRRAPPSTDRDSHRSGPASIRPAPPGLPRAKRRARVWQGVPGVRALRSWGESHGQPDVGAFGVGPTPGTRQRSLGREDTDHLVGRRAYRRPGHTRLHPGSVRPTTSRSPPKRRCQ